MSFDHEIGSCCDHCKADTERGRRELQELAMAVDSPSLTEHLAKVSGKLPFPSRQPIKRPQIEHRSWALRADGKKGDVVLVEQEIDCLCRVERFYAKDTAGNEGTRVSFRKLYPQYPHWQAARPTKEWTHEAQSLGCGINFGVFQPGTPFVVEVEFLTDCEWDACIIAAMAKR